MAKKIVVTGGAGFIGSNITDELVKEGFDVHVIDNLSGGKKENVNPKATLHVLDMRDFEKIKPIISGAEFVFHLAALPRVQYSIEHPIETNDVNIGGIVSVLTAAKEGGVKRVIYSASSSAYGDQPTMPLVESMSASPKSPYGLHKYVGELYCRLWSEIYELETVSLRYFNVYGPRQSAEGAYALVIAKFLKQKAEGKTMTITGDGKQTRDFTHVSDVVQANLLASKSKKVGKGEVINIGRGQNCSINKIAELIGGPVEHIPARFEPKDTLADNRLAKELLGWVPEMSIEEGIRELQK
ncbi:NAD-dependent epimerase/dehydratase family protein [Candidatus Parcubacteria bacterium]|nr:NAD-dependent epimerase/dehydratase family protein [Candidatus Parcubacteria bacterium]